MKRLLIKLATLLLLLPGITTASSDLDQPEVLGAVIDGMVQPLMRDHNSPAGTVVIIKNGRVILARGYGFENIAEQKPVDVYTTLFRPGSVSKLFTWVAVMQQVERGRLNLDVDVNNYLTTFKIKNTFEQPVTLRHIMSHTPGFEDGGIGYLIIEDPSKALPLREAMAKYQPLRINPPGVQTAYSNYGAALAGLMVENVSGLAFADYIKQHIFDPLGMQNSSFEQPLPPRFLEQMTESYAEAGGVYMAQPFEIISSFSPAGGMSASATDMAKFALAILNRGEFGGGRILQADSVDELLTRQFSHDQRMMGMALGFYETERNGIRLLGHDGDTAWFHSELVLDKHNDLAYYVSFAGAGGGAVRSVFKNGFYNHFFPVDEAPPVPPADFAMRAAEYTGSYWLWRSNFSGIEKALGMADEFQVTATDNNTLSIAIDGAAKQYVEVEDLLFRELDPGFTFGGGMSPRLVSFQRDDDGRISGFILDEWPFMSLRKKPFYETMHFLKPAVAFCYLMFLALLFGVFDRRRTLPLLPANERLAIRALVISSAAFCLLLIIGWWVMCEVAGQLRSEVPLLFKLSLLVPMLVSVTGVHVLYHCVRVWQKGLFGGVSMRMAYTLLTSCALFMVWVLYFWNLLGLKVPG